MLSGKARETRQKPELGMVCGVSMHADGLPMTAHEAPRTMHGARCQAVEEGGGLEEHEE